MAEKGNIILYTTPDGVSKIEATLQEDTVWLTLDQMAELFQRNKSTISRHIKNIFEEGELDEISVVAKNATTTQHGVIQGKIQTHREYTPQRGKNPKHRATPCVCKVERHSP